MGVVLKKEGSGAEKPQQVDVMWAAEAEIMPREFGTRRGTSGRVHSGWEIRQPSLCWLPPTVPSPPTLHSLNTHSHRLTSPVADLQRFSTEALEIRGKWWKSAFISTLACNLRMQQLFPCSFLPASVPTGVLVWGEKTKWGKPRCIIHREYLTQLSLLFFFFGLSAVGGNRVQRGNTMCERRKEEGFNNSYRLHEEGSTLKTSIQPQWYTKAHYAAKIFTHFTRIWTRVTSWS